ncbi:cupin domain-containing protein [Clostridium sp. D2Q-14]|uniref:cupin domain-containing protein n=1 Tax=Anaeromonas gelatinilytica TaxID=2683194 RepID=UPI00193BE7EF|nr:cupin domain-containing protein [Anaeromonas gelatinilytica]MBS4535638.1 cupin domain-containing protein [Anaeromonas gelatinilytica]
MNKPFAFAEDRNFETVSEGVKRKILAYGDQLMAVEVHFEKDAVGALHSHPHTQLSYVLEGEFEFEINGVKKVVKKGDTLYKMPNLVHGCKCTKKGTLLDIFTPYREDFINKK